MSPLRTQLVMSIALRHGWSLVAFDKAPNTLEFQKADGFGPPMKMQVFYTSGKVSTVVNHPKKGRNQMFRHHVGRKQLEKIALNPRVHTRNGYRRKR